MKSNYLWLLDAGHGGIKNGIYTTAPAKMHTFQDGLIVYEGVINRAITKLVWLRLVELGIDFKLVYDEIEDDSLMLRVKRADDIFAKDRRAIYLSVHSNAGGGSGFEIFTSPGQSKSDKIANIFCETYQKFLPQFPFRSDKADGDADKEEAFYVLRKTDCPAVLIENLFFDNRHDAEFLKSEDGQRKISDCIVHGIRNVEQLKPI
jgi:N-acetylmuramoyl-L-alanine amidase